MWVIILIIISVLITIYFVKAIRAGYKCPVCEKQINNISDLSNGKFNNLPICKECIKIINLYRGGEKNETVYLDDLKEIVNDYHNKQNSFLDQTEINQLKQILIVDKETGEIIEDFE